METTFTLTVLRSLMNTEAYITSKNSSNLHNVFLYSTNPEPLVMSRCLMRLMIFTLNGYKSCLVSNYWSDQMTNPQFIEDIGSWFCTYLHV